MSQKVKALSEEQSVRLARKNEGKESGFCSKKKQQFLEDGIKSRLGPGGIFSPQNRDHGYPKSHPT